MITCTIKSLTVLLPHPTIPVTRFYRKTDISPSCNCNLAIMNFDQRYKILTGKKSLCTCLAFYSIVSIQLQDELKLCFKTKYSRIDVCLLKFVEEDIYSGYI